jgi:transposase
VNPELMIPSAEMERMMKVQEEILRAMAGSLKWWEAAEIIGVCDRTMRRWRERYEAGGYDGLYDRRKRRPSPKRVPLRVAEEVLRLYRERYYDFNVRHFHEKLTEVHGLRISYTWVKMALQGAGLVSRRRQSGPEPGDATGAGVAGVGDPDDSRLLAPGPGADGAELSDLEWVFSLQQERTVNGDNTIQLNNRVLPITKTRWRDTLAGCKVTVYEHLNGMVVVRLGPHEVARFAPDQLPVPESKRRTSPRPLGHKRNAA